jgi:branched-chain amino acid transport system substrate-binding protein
VTGKIAILSTLAIVIAAAMPAAAPTRAATPYVIDVVMPLTGGAAFLGKGEQQSMQLAEKLVNGSGGIQGSPLQLVFHDDQSNPQTSVLLTGPLVEKKPAVILGSSLVARCRAMAPLMKDGPVEYCFSPGIHPDAGYVFSASLSTLDLIDASVRYSRMKGWKRVALIFSTDATGQDAENGVKSVLARPENKEMQVVATAHYNITDVSVSAQIETLKAAKPQVLIAWSTGSPIATIFQGLVQAGLDVPVVTTAGNMTYAQMKQYAAFLPKRLVMAAPQWVVTDPKQLPPGVVAAHKAYFGAFAAAGIRPDQSSDLPWDATMTVVAALRKLGTGASAEQIRDFIAHQQNLPGIEGLYDFVKIPQRGLDVSDTVVTEWSPKANTWVAMSKAGGTPLP